MKKSLLHTIIREEIKAALDEASNSELDKFVSNFVKRLATIYGYKSPDAVMATFEAMKRLNLIHKDVNYKAPSGFEVVAEGAYESATRNELAMYISLLSTALRNEKADGNTAMVDFLTKDIEEVKAALKAKGGGVAESSKPLKEYTKTNFQATVPGSGRAKIDPAFFAKLMPKSAKTSKEAEARIKLYNGSTMFVHSQYFDVTPNGNMPNKPIYQLHQQQYYNNDYNAPANLKGESVNVTFLTIIDITDGGKGVDVGVCYVDTKVFLEEYKVLFQLIKKVS